VSGLNKFESAKKLRASAKFNKLNTIRSIAPAPNNDEDNKEMKLETDTWCPFVELKDIPEGNDEDDCMIVATIITINEEEEKKQECSNCKAKKNPVVENILGKLTEVYSGIKDLSLAEMVELSRGLEKVRQEACSTFHNPSVISKCQ